MTSLWSSQLDDHLQAKIESEPHHIKSLYSLNANRPLWIGHAKNFHTLSDALQNSYFNYKHKNFHQDIIDQYSYLLHNDMNLEQNIEELTQLDIALTKSYIALANFIVHSDVDWKKVSQKLEELKESKDIKAHWEMVTKSNPSSSELFNAIVNQNIDSFLHSLTPLPKHHKELIEALHRYEKMGELPKVLYGKDIKYGDYNKRIPAIKERLVISGDYQREANYSEEFDNKLQESIRSYKRRFNLEENNLIDKVTIYYLNKPIDLLVESIITNLDKLKVFPNTFPKEYIMVNIPDFTMDYYKNDVSILHMNAVVGRDQRPTPIFASSMTYLELNPNWNIPESLVRKDLIPTMIEHPNYLKENNIHVFKGWKDKKEIKDFKVEKLLPYQDKNSGHIPYRFVQYPGDNNALGRIKFMFPNKYSVYLHDTDNKSLFARRYRVYSSGCMRIQRPFELLEILKPRLKSQDVKKIDFYRNNLKNKVLKFTKSLSIQTAYFTVFKRNELIFFRKDIYGYDKLIQKSLITPPPKEDIFFRTQNQYSDI